MKIAMVIPKYGLVGGAESFAYEVSERLASRKRFEIHVFANQWRRGNPPITFHKIPVVPFPRFLRPISFAYFANERIRREHFHLVHSQDRIFKMDLLTMHGTPHKIWVKEARRRSLTLFDRSIDWVEKKGITGSPTPMILPVSNLVKDELLKLYDIPATKLRVIHPGAAAERFSILDREGCRNEIRQRHGLNLSDVVVLFVGMNFEIKRLELILKGVADLVAKEETYSVLKLLVVGKGKTERYMSLARDLAIADRIIFVGVTREVEKYYLASDIFAMPSKFDTFGLAVLEAMIAGLPVIITQKVGAKDLIDSGVQGFVLEDEPSPIDLGEKVAFLVEKENRMKMGERARKVALLNTWDKTANQIADLYDELTN
jgi:UDP-glucose:(heptosyl)LPS alpha-1,3-glucosyltransferase